MDFILVNVVAGLLSLVVINLYKDTPSKSNWGPWGDAEKESPSSLTDEFEKSLKSSREKRYITRNYGQRGI